MAGKGHSEKNIFGGYNHYDEHGKKVGHSEPNIFGGYNDYDEHGRKIGTSNPNLFGGYTRRDNQGRKVGESDPNLFGGYTHRDRDGRKTGESNPDLFGGYRNSDSRDGCYIATCVYGSYDCPQVWTLRRFRDSRLRRTRAGRLFIRMYYAVSPALVRHFGTKPWFRRPWRAYLDRMVARLNGKGYSDSPYRGR